MPILTIDGRPVALRRGQTILEGARALGIEIPTLCHADGLPHLNSCMVCLVREVRTAQFLPACSYPVDDDLVVEASSDEVVRARRDAIELLLREHLGDCEAPCRRGCPADLDIPAMMRAIQGEDWNRAGRIVREHVCLPRILGAICPAPCERLCRRSDWDSALAICRLKGFIGEDGEGVAAAPSRSSAFSVAVVGGGPAGAAAAWHLRLQGHSCTVFDKASAPYAPLLGKVGENRLAPAVVRADYAAIANLGVVFRGDWRLTDSAQLEALRRRHDAVLLAGGEEMSTILDLLGVRVAASDPFTTSVPGVFACGGVRIRMRLAARAVGEGRQAAEAIDRFLVTGAAATAKPRFDSRAGRLGSILLADLAGNSPRAEKVPSPPRRIDSRPEAVREAGRCMSCDCGAKAACRLRDYAEIHEIPPVRPHPPEDLIDRPAVREHPQLVFSPGKCIHCGLCVRLAEQRGEPLGLAFTGRGRQTRLAVPFGKSLAAAIVRDAVDYARLCPTGALAEKRGGGTGQKTGSTGKSAQG